MVADRTVYVSGCLGLDKDTGKIVSGGVVPESKLALENLKNVLLAAGSDIDKVVKTTVFLQDLEEFSLFNEIYKTGLRDNSSGPVQFNSCGFFLSSFQFEFSGQVLLSSSQASLECSHGDRGGCFDR